MLFVGTSLLNVCFAEKKRFLCNRVATKPFSFAAFAHLANPNLIELVHGLFDNRWVVGENARFEVACSFAFHADSGSSKVGASDVDFLAVEDNHLEMDARTEHTLQAVE